MRFNKKKRLIISNFSGTRECFHQFLNKDLNIEVDFQVVSGGDLDISLWISSPTNRVIVHHQRKVTGQPQFKTEETGEYRICFDNSFSRFASKQVHFYMGVMNDDKFVDPNFNVEPVLPSPQSLDLDQLGELDHKIQTFRDTFMRVYNNLEKAQTHMTAFRIYELADRELMEQSFERVNFFSIFNITLMILVGLIQTFMIRSLFEDRSKFGRLLRGSKESSERKINY